jgi:anaerobic selenocysteine-containing dehydrogenase
MTDDTVTHIRTCPLCEATCGLELRVEGDEVTRIRGDRKDVLSKGFVCPKGSVLHHVHTDPDRLRAPMVRRGDTHVEVTWDEAFAEVEERLVPLLEEQGRNACAIYLGNPAAHGHALPLAVRPLLMALGTQNLYSASTVDQMPKHVSAGLMFGDGLTIPVPDIDRTDLLLMLGANPWESNGSLWTAPDLPGRLTALQERGGRFIVVDPRRTKTAAHADEHLRIRPGADAHWLLALANVLVDEDLVAPGRLAEHCDGLDLVPDAVAPFTPEAVTDATGIDEDTTRRVARDLAGAERAVAYGRIGTHTVAFGTLASWAVDLLNALTGNLDEPGGAMFPHPAHTRPHSETPGGRGFTIGRYRSRVKGHPEVRRELPVATLADEIEKPGEGQVTALITVAGNPTRSTPDSTRLEAALETLELMISVDPALNETTRYADVILPPPSPLERSHYDLAFTGLAVRNVANWSPALFDPTGPSETEIIARLGLIAQGMGADADPAIVTDLVVDALLGRAVADGQPCAGRDVAELRDELVATAPEDRALEVMVRTGSYGDQFGLVPDGLTFGRLVEEPHGIDLGPLTPQLPQALRTPNGRVDLMPAPIHGDLPRLVDDLSRHRDGELVLVGRRHLRSNNSWMHNVKVLVKGRERCTLQVHPDDAARLTLTDGGRATVASRVGDLEAPVEVTDSVMPGVVSLPHGWGHDAGGTRQAVAREHAGVNSNALTDGSIVDPLSGNAVLNGIPVTVTPSP